MALPLGDALRSAGRFLSRNPLAMVRMARHAVGFRVAVPLDALRWFVQNTPPAQNAPTDVTIAATPPAITLGATVNMMGTTVRATASIEVEQMIIHSEAMRVELRLSNVDMKLIGESDSPVAGLLKSGALDLSKPGNLMNFMPKRPPTLVEAKDDRIVLDLMKDPKVASNFRLRRLLGTLTPVIKVAALRTDNDFLILAFRPTPFGFPKALQAARA